MSACWQAVSAARDAANSCAPLAGTKIVVRRRPFWSQPHGDPLPLVVVSYAAEKIGGLTFNDSWIDYTVTLTIFQDRGPALEDVVAQQWLLDAREGLRLALFRGGPLPGLSSCWDCVGYDPDPAYDAGGLDGQLGVSRQAFVFRNTEARR